MKFFYLIFIFLVQSSIATAGFNIPILFMPLSGSQLQFTTAAQNIYTANCSGTATVQTSNGDAAVNVAFALTVNLSAPGVTFYADSACTTIITSVVVAGGTSSSDFYFIAAAAGPNAITASATSYTSARQIETTTANPFIWTGGGGNVSWATAGNWSGGAAPGASDKAVFDGSCVANCLPTIDTSISVGSVRMATSYAGTITQAAGFTMAISGWTQLAGIFMGSNASVWMNGPFFLNAGSYKATSGMTSFLGSYHVSGSPTFLNNAGTFTFSGSVISVGSESYNNVTLSLGGSATLTGTMNVAGDFLANNANFCCQSMNGGTINVLGNITLSNSGIVPENGGFGSTILKVAGSGTQTITGVSSAFITNLVIASTGTVNFVGDIRIIGTYTFTSGTLNAGTSTIVFYGYNGAGFTAGTETYNNVTFQLSSFATSSLTGTMNVAGTLLGNGATYCCQQLSGGTIRALGNVTLTNFGFGPASGGGGSTLIKLAGSGTQTVTGVSSGFIPNLEIASSGTVNFVGPIQIMGNYKFTSGALSAGTSTLILLGFNAATFTVGTEIYNNVTFSLSQYTTENLVGTMNVAGTLTGNDTNYCCQSLNGGTIKVTGNVSLTGYGLVPSSGGGGTTVVDIAGSASQTLTGTSGSNFPNLKFDSTGGTVSLSGANNVIGSTVVTAGIVQLATASDSFTTQSLSLNGNVFTKNGGTLVVNGTVVGAGMLYGGIVAP